MINCLFLMICIIVCYFHKLKIAYYLHLEIEPFQASTDHSAYNLIEIFALPIYLVTFNCTISSRLYPKHV